MALIFFGILLHVNFAAGFCNFAIGDLVQALGWSRIDIFTISDDMKIVLDMKKALDLGTVASRVLPKNEGDILESKVNQVLTVFFRRVCLLAKA